jgi:hypothetical protein
VVLTYRSRAPQGGGTEGGAGNDEDVRVAVEIDGQEVAVTLRQFLTLVRENNSVASDYSSSESDLDEGE